MHCRLLIDEARSGPYNMAVDEALLESAIANPRSCPVLRWYRWSTPTLSLGYFQSFQDRPNELAGVDCVRRITGGGAILHDREITYSLIFPAGTWPRENSVEVVEELHGIFRDVLQASLTVSLAGTAEGGADPFLCFERRAPVDVVAGERKVIGSAQRKRQGALLQHGSILLASSPHARHLPGLRDLGGNVAEQDFLDTVHARLVGRWQLELEASQLSAEEAQRVETLRVEKYGAAAWVRQR